MSNSRNFLSFYAKVYLTGSDCGLFTIATATTLCHGEDPVDLEYDQSSMWSHLLKAFSTKALLHFPAKTTRKRQKRRILHRKRIAAADYQTMGGRW